MILLLSAAAGARADWVELTNGTRVEGTIVSVSGKEIAIEAQTSPTIKEVRNIPRGEVAKFEKATADDVAFLEVQGIKIPATARSAAFYDDMLTNKVQPFMKSYAYSKHMPEARKLAEQLQKERDRLAAGDAKIEGVWVTAQELQTQPDTAARLALAEMTLVEADPVTALTAFDAFEKKYNTSAVYPDAIRKALAYLSTLRSAISARTSQLQRQAEEQKSNSAKARPEDKAKLDQAARAEADAIRAQAQQARATGAKWIPLVDDVLFLNEQQQKAQNEEARLNGLNPDNLASGVNAANRAKTELAAGNLETAQTAIDEAARSFPQYQPLNELRTKILQARATAARPTPTPAAPQTPAPAPAKP